jgi:hypothetical protein
MRLTPIKAAVFTVVSVSSMALGSVSAKEDYQWGSISIGLGGSPVDPSYGIGGGDSMDEAIKNAQRFCRKSGGDKCETVVSYQQCGGYAASPNGWGSGWGTTKKVAEAAAISKCNDDRCKIVVSDCN